MPDDGKGVIEPAQLLDQLAREKPQAAAVGSCCPQAVEVDGALHRDQPKSVAMKSGDQRGSHQRSEDTGSTRQRDNDKGHRPDHT